ncbi:MAG: hypothetical protein LC793_13650 [Thermomicrobia bacterium]|nr:hypothetical protein [Thermomicrobia bacterium]MCA1722708.1 hypothetical protein [Thermomicrobia bacterium]
MQEEAGRPAFVFTEAPGDPSVSRSTYENEDGIFFLSVHAREHADKPTSYLINIFNMGDPMDEEGTVFIAPWAQTLCAFAPEWIAADPDVNLIEAAEDAAMSWLDVEDVELGATRYLVFTEDQPEGEERDWPGA